MQKYATKLSTVAGSLLLGLSVAGCSSVGKQVSDIVFWPHSQSTHTEGEKTNLTVVPYKPVLEDSKKLLARLDKLKKSIDDTEGFLQFGPAGIAASLISAAFDQVGKELDRESKRYLATYSATTSARIDKKLEGLFVFERYVGLNAKEPDSAGKIAMRYCGVLVSESKPTSQGKEVDLVRVIPYGLDLYMSKAKVVAFDLTSPFGIDFLNPWEGITNQFSDNPGKRGVRLIADDQIDLTIEHSLTARKIDTKSYSLKTVNLGTLEKKIKNVPFEPLSPSKKHKESADQNHNPQNKKVGLPEKSCDTLSKEAETLEKAIASLEKTDKDVSKLEEQVEKAESVSEEEKISLKTKIESLRTEIEKTKNDVSEIELSEYQQTVDQKKPGNDLFLMPVNDNDFLDYAFKIKVTEIDNFSERVKELSTNFEENKEGWQSELTDYFSN